MAERKNTSPSAGPKKTPPAPEGFVPAGDTSREDAVTVARLEAERAQVDASTMEAAPEDQKSPTGGSFVNPSTVGSGTILPDGTYGAPLPDPMVARLAELKDQAEAADSQ